MLRKSKILLAPIFEKHELPIIPTKDANLAKETLTRADFKPSQIPSTEDRFSLFRRICSGLDGIMQVYGREEASVPRR